MNNYIVIPLTEAILKAGDRVRLVEPEILIERSKSDIKYTQDNNGIYSFDFKYDFIENNLEIIGLDEDDEELLNDVVIPNAKSFFEKKDKIANIENKIIG